MRYTVMLMLVCGVCGNGVADVWYVDVDNTGTHDGTSWATAFNAVQEGIDAAFNDGGGEVWVAEGVYSEHRISFPDGPQPGNTGSVMMKEGVHLYGGFAGTETTREQRDWNAHVTTLDGATARNGEPAYHVIVGTNNSTLDGFTITGGAGGAGGGMYNDYSSPTVTNCAFTGNSASNGGGMFNNASVSNPSTPMVSNCTFAGNSASNVGGGMCNWDSSQPRKASTGVAATVINCTFTDNSASSEGGGMYNLRSSPTVINCTFSSNSSVEGGGMYNLESLPTLTNCTFTDNLSDGNNGGGMCNLRSSPTVIRCTFFRNSALGASFGWGMANESSSPTVTNCIFTGNLADGYGGIYNSSSFSTITNCTITGNLSREVGGMGEFWSSSTVVNCIFWANETGQIYGSPSVTYSDVQGGFTGVGNIDLDPLFSDAAIGDLSLRLSSPCIDSGVADSTAEYDILGICRPQGAGFDMGAYEYIGLPQVALTMSAVGSGEVFPAVGMHPFQQGTILTCHVTPTLWWRFQGWSGAITDTASAISLTMDANKSLTATFVKPAVEQITGVVTDWRSGLGLPDASVTVTETDLGREICSDTTDVNGAFGLDAPGETLLDVAITKGEGGAEGEGEPPCQLSLFGCCLLR